MGIILTAETINIFGYNISSLKPSSEKLVIWQCLNCHTNKEKKFRYAIKNLYCLNCSNKINANTNLNDRANKIKEWHSKNNHPLLGIERPQYVKDAISKAQLGVPVSEEIKLLLSVKFSGSGNPFYGKTHSAESLKKMCDYQQINKRTGKDCNFYGKIHHGKGNWYKCNDGSKVWMRSSWELKFAEYLDKNKIKWLYEPKQFPITYNNKEGTYSPDFYLIEENRYIEIKGWWRDDAKLKFNTFISQYPLIKIDLYQKQELKKLNII